MNQSISRVRAFLLFLILVPALANAQNLAQVVYASGKGASVSKTDSAIEVKAGAILPAGCELKSGEATVILSICDGSLITVYPQSTLQITTLEPGVVEMSLLRGEILGDNEGSCGVAVETKAGRANVKDGVFGIVLSDDGEEGWTLQIRNLDGTVSFIGQPNLDTSATIITLLEPNKEVNIPAGEEFVIRGIYDSESEVFALAQDGVALAALSEVSFSAMREEVQFMNAAMQEWSNQQPAENLQSQPPPEEIEIPYDEVDISSDPG